jgi:hypothetical protein
MNMSETPTEPRRPEQLLADVAANVDTYVGMINDAEKPLTTPELMVFILDASQRRPDLLALLLATTLQTLAAERMLNA